MTQKSNHKNLARNLSLLILVVRAGLTVLDIMSKVFNYGCSTKKLRVC
jgi:hypothetical protein